MITAHMIPPPTLDILKDIDPWIKRRGRLGDRQLEYREDLQLLSQAANTGNRISTEDFYSRLVESMSNNSLEETLGFDGNQLINLFRRTFGPWCLDNLKKSFLNSATIRPYLFKTICEVTEVPSCWHARCVYRTEKPSCMPWLSVRKY